MSDKPHTCCECDKPCTIDELVDPNHWFCAPCWPIVEAELAQIREELAAAEAEREAERQRRAAGPRKVLADMVEETKGGTPAWRFKRAGVVMMGNAALDALETLGFDRHEELARAGAWG